MRTRSNPCLIRPTLVALTTVAMTMAAAPSPVSACGGFFCNNAQPVNQTAERIIFSKNADGTVTAVVEILYEGPGERFAWVLPVPGSPAVGISSKTAFDAIQSATNPVYSLNFTGGTGCGDGGGGGLMGGQGPVDAGSSADGGSAVTVVDSGSVGPYDYVTIMVDPEAADAADAAVTWLQDNDYDVDDRGRDTLRPYLASGLNLIAFRLTKGQSSGSIRPIRITYESDAPMIPIRPTAVAADPDMGILVWVLGEHRAVPINYRDLELNEARIDWFNPSATYNAVVTEAANEAGGQGFVTEMAGPADLLADSIWSSWQEQLWLDFQSNASSLGDRDLVIQASIMLAVADGYAEVLRAHVPVPEGVDPDAFYGCPNCYLYDETGPIVGFDAAAFVSELETKVIAPIRDTAALFRARPYVTRLYTTMSADEMTADPVFDFNPTRPDHSIFHSADLYFVGCNMFRVTLVSGDVIYGENNTWPRTTTDALPANRRILQQSTTGEGAVLMDNADEIGAALAVLVPPGISNPTTNNPSGTPGGSAGGSSGGTGGSSRASAPSSGSSGCAVTGSAGSPPARSPAGGLLLIALGAVLVVRRRRGA